MAVVGYIKRKNMLDVISCIRKGPVVTKTEIVKKTGLTMGTINTFVDELKATGLVTESGIALSTGGRKSVLYSFNPQSFYMVGVSITLTDTSIGLFDYSLTRLDSVTIGHITDGHGIEKEINVIYSSINGLLYKNQIPADKVAGIGVSVPGLVNYNKGVIIELPHIPAWKNVPLAQILHENTGIHALVDNNNNCNALALKWNDSRYDHRNMIFLSTIEGIGIGIIINGDIYRGSRHLAGEIGHITVNPSGAECACGSKGCIELYAANPEICKTAQENLGSNKKSELYRLCGGKPFDMQMLTKAAKTGDTFALQVLEDSVFYISLCVENVIKTYDPDCVVLNTLWLDGFPDLKAKMIDGIFARTEFIRRDEMQIALCDDESLYLRAAANLVLDNDLRLENPEGILHRLCL